MHSQELELLLREYRDADTSEDRLILEKLKAIAALTARCRGDEFVFANEVTFEFCRLVKILKEQKEKAAAKKDKGAIFVEAPTHTAFVAYRSTENLPFADGDELLVSFYNRFRNEQKKKGEGERIDYPAIKRLNDLKSSAAVSSTVNDYVARIKTFVRRYMQELPRISALWREIDGPADAVLFTYINLELVLAEFSTKNEDGSVNKQKSNIQSALRKLNEFKRIR